ncbi:hypothetical protein QLQ80_01295 [Mycoplasma sp. M5725]|uniref:Lipoprotein n=1 Tax=Mycoplasma phocimorsus TaxID=3045839 RepID=A0AAJ1PQY8_9MOLU|nr:hypothetical protein [Mycoplasma phocimorsus]MDJ1645724.1 hypothetical protein [Mycoplasma phocimorsus]
MKFKKWKILLALSLSSFIFIPFLLFGCKKNTIFKIKYENTNNIETDNLTMYFDNKINTKLNWTNGKNKHIFIGWKLKNNNLTIESILPGEKQDITLIPSVIKEFEGFTEAKNEFFTLYKNVIEDKLINKIMLLIYKEQKEKAYEKYKTQKMIVNLINELKIGIEEKKNEKKEEIHQVKEELKREEPISFPALPLIPAKSFNKPRVIYKNKNNWAVNIFASIGAATMVGGAIYWVVEKIRDIIWEKSLTTYTLKWKPKEQSNLFKEKTLIIKLKGEDWKIGGDKPHELSTEIIEKDFPNFFLERNINNSQNNTQLQVEINNGKVQAYNALVDSEWFEVNETEQEVIIKQKRKR